MKMQSDNGTRTAMPNARSHSCCDARMLKSSTLGVIISWATLDPTVHSGASAFRPEAVNPLNDFLKVHVLEIESPV